MDGVGVVKRGREPEHRRCMRSEFIAKITPGLQGIALGRERTGTVRIGEELVVEGDLVATEDVAGPEAPIFAHWKAEPQAASGACRRVGRVVPIIQVEAPVIAPEQLSSEQDLLVEEIGIGKAKLDRLGKKRVIDRRVE